MFEITIIISTLFFLLLIYSLYSILKLHSKKKTEYEIELGKIKLEYEKNLLTTQIEIQEQTFQNISREIHDHILQKLTLAKLYLHSETEVSNKKNGHLLKLVSEVINDLGDISRSLNADIILNNGLINALEAEIALLKKLEKHSINLYVHGEYIFLSNKKELILFRIIQESLNNVLKHAESETIDITLNFLEKKLIVEVKDTGKGYEPNTLKNGRRAGIVNMVKRAEMIGGELKITSVINQGTVIRVEIPYENKY